MKYLSSCDNILVNEDDVDVNAQHHENRREVKY
jgi:hypothetical protein